MGSNKGEKVLYTYGLTHLDNSKKVRFVYALKGRSKSDGLILKVKGEFLVNGCFIVSASYEKEVDLFLRYWKVQFTKKHIKLIH
tara:strand:+ start:152 stop:403 length:252 start_codon:yes stop_codon:yes gene_type:complete